MSIEGDDRECVARSCRGDTRAFERIYRRYGHKVFGIAYRLTLDRGHAEDLTQEAFVRIWQQLSNFRFESALSTWIYRVATNVVLADLRRPGGVKGGLNQGGLKLVATEPGAAPEQTCNDDTGMAIDIERQLLALPERARLVLVMHDLVGLTHEEIGQQLGIAAGTSKAQLFRARALYREMDQQDGGAR